MSEPMSTHDIEDVLSSIRRLVSEDLRPVRPGEPVTPEGPGKLLLTPALRVVSDPEASEAPEAPESLDGVGEDVAATEATRGLTQDTDAGAAVPEAAGVSDEGWGPGAVEPVRAVSEPAPALPVENVVSRLGAAVAEEEWESPFGDPEIWQIEPEETLPRFKAAPRASALEARFAETFVEAPMADFASVQAEFDAPPAFAAVAGRPARETRPSEEDAGWADAAEAAVRADLARETEEEVISDLERVQTGGMTFDEEVLRDLVRDLIREELSGNLGERITRNVRKLVRAEIARALAVREFQ